MVKRGRYVPWFRLATLGGVSKSRASFHGKPTLFYLWASWHESRERLPRLQQYSETNIGGVSLVTIAMDVQGPEFPMRYLRAAGATFTTLIDVSSELSRQWGVRSLPCAILADRYGVCRLTADDVSEDLFLKSIPTALEGRPDRLPVERKLKPLNPPTFEIHMQYANNLLGRGRKEEAVGELQKAWMLDPKNSLVRPQMWAIAHPDRFYLGAIDAGWQKAQLDATRTIRLARRSR